MSLQILGVCGLQDPRPAGSGPSPPYQYSDEMEYSHQPSRLLLGHMGCFWSRTRIDALRIMTAMQGCPDRSLLQSSSANGPCSRSFFLSWLVLLPGSFAGELFLGGTPMQAVQFASIIADQWACFLRRVPWSGISLVFELGYASRGLSRYAHRRRKPEQTIFIGIISHVQGWHNHHLRIRARPGMAIAGGIDSPSNGRLFGALGLPQHHHLEPSPRCARCAAGGHARDRVVSAE